MDRKNSHQERQGSERLRKSLGDQSLHSKRIHWEEDIYEITDQGLALVQEGYAYS